MKKPLLIYLWGLFISPNLALGQSMTIEHVIQWINLCDSTIEVSPRDNLFIINGVPFEGERLTEELRKIDYSDPRVTVDYLFSEDVENTIFKPQMLIILILNENEKLKKKIKREGLLKYRALFSDSYVGFSNHIKSDAKDPGLLLDGKKVHHTQAGNILDQLKVKDVHYLSNVNHAPQSIYGQNAKNGLVRIFTKR